MVRVCRGSATWLGLSAWLGLLGLRLIASWLGLLVLDGETLGFGKQVGVRSEWPFELLMFASLSLPFSCPSPLSSFLPW